MTADVRIVVQDHPDVLVVPNVALSFRLPKAEDAQNLSPGQGLVWLLAPSGNLVHTIVSMGATGESVTEITSPDIKVGEKVAIGYRSGR
jgi:HlyD family secretion protein